MAIFEVTQDRFIPLDVTTFSSQGLKERGDLQRLLREQVDIIAADVLVVSEEFGGWEDSRRRVDLLGVDRDANLVVIELKRTEDGGHMELQAIRYAAMVSQMTFEKVVEIFASHLADRDRPGDARQLLLDFLGWESPDENRFAADVRIVLAAAEFSRELTSAVLWLNERGLDIRCVRMRPYRDGARVFVDVQQVLPLPEASEYFVNLREKQAEERQARRKDRDWSGLWFVNVGMHEDRPAADADGRGYPRHWTHCVRLGYLAAGGGPRYSGPLRGLNPGDEVLAYQKKKGYVGYGVVTHAAEPIHQLRLDDGRTLAAALNCGDYNDDGRPEDDWEYAVRIEWRKHFDLADAKTFKGAFANQNIVCKLTEPATVRFLRDAFDIPERSAG
jgi:hypothetical protein